MKKKVASLILAASLAAGFVVGCGSSSDSAADSGSAGSAESTADSADVAADTEDETETSDAEQNLTVFWWGNQVRNERTQNVLNMFAEENPGVSFDGQFADGTDYWTRLATLAAGHSLADVIQMDYSYLAQYANNGLLVDLTPYIDDGTIDLTNVSDTIVNTGKVGDGIYGICNGVNAPSLFYNKTILEDAGIEVKDNMTLDEFKALCKEVYEKTGYKTSLTYGSNTNTQYLEYLLRAKGLTFYEDGTAFGVDSAEDFVAFFQLFKDGIDEGWHVDPGVYAERQAASVEQDCLVYGSSPDAMSWCAFYSSNQLVAMQNAAPEGTDIGITTWPSDDVVKSNYLKPSQFFCVTTDSNYPDTSAKLIDYITNSVDANNVLLGERGVPISSVVADAISENQSEKDQEVVKFINEVVTPNCSQINPAAPSAGSEIQALVDRLVSEVLYAEVTPEEAAKELYEQGNEKLAAKAD